MKEIAMWVVTAALIRAVLIGAYWLAKRGSYWLWYEDMVKETIQEMVKAEALRGS